MQPRLALFVLTLIATVPFFDRALMVVVMKPIERGFALGDARLGLLAGFSYAAAPARRGRSPPPSRSSPAQR